MFCQLFLYSIGNKYGFPLLNKEAQVFLSKIPGTSCRSLRSMVFTLGLPENFRGVEYCVTQQRKKQKNL